jgi:hypothetical protein
MGPRDVKLLTGTRLGGRSVRVPKEKLSRIRSGIHKLEAGLIQRKDQIKFIDGIVGQLRYVKHLNPKDASALIENLALAVNGTQTSASATKFLGSKRQ